MSKAYAFEYEWLADGSLRLRFLDREEGILGQQVIAAEAMLALQILVGMAVAKSSAVAPESLISALRKYLNVDLDTAQALIDSVRIRAGVTPEGNIRIDAIE